MCGILGIVGDAEASAGLLDVVSLMTHRGPDSEGRYVSPGIALAMRRLAIIDVEGGDQPVANEGGDIVCICNGEIYNYVELRSELAARGHAFSTQGDVEVIPHLYEELGEHCFERLRGMFAVALWDSRRRRLVLARDRFGIKPLYLAEKPAGLAFASEIPPLLALGADAEPDLTALADYLSLAYVPGEATGLRGVRSLAPGTALVWEDGRRRETQYVEAEFGGDDTELEDALAEAVGLHLRSDVPLAVLLSGGLDSSLIAALAVGHLDRPLQTFTVVFDDPEYSERSPARLVAEAIHSEHHEVEVRSRLETDIVKIVKRLDEPNADPAAIPLWYVCRAAAEMVKVALAGEGGDEVFGGYSRYAWDGRAAKIGQLLPAAALARVLERLPGVSTKARGSDRKGVVRRTIKLLRHAELPAAERYFSWFALFSEEAKAELLGRNGLPATTRVFAELFEASPPQLTKLGRLQYVDVRTMLTKDLLVKADRMSMAHSLELRVPLLDHEVVRAGFGQADAEKVNGVKTKIAIRELVARKLPKEIARRPKQGFDVPIDAWMRGELSGLARDVLAEGAGGLLNAGASLRLLDRHLAREADVGAQLYSLLVLGLWRSGVRAPQRSLSPEGG